MLETVLQLGQIDAARGQIVVNILELFLSGHDDPSGVRNLPSLQSVETLLAKLLNDRAEVFEAFAAAGHVLAHLVDYKRKGLAGPSQFAEIKRALDKIFHCQASRWTALHDFQPGVGGSVGPRVELVQKCAGPCELLV